jgi:hypothetical protein
LTPFSPTYRTEVSLADLAEEYSGGRSTIDRIIHQTAAPEPDTSGNAVAVPAADPELPEVRQIR